MSDNPLLKNDGLPAFDIIAPQHVEPAVTELLLQAEQLLQKAETAELGNWNQLTEPLGQIDLLFEYGWSPVSHLLGVANSDEFRTAHEKMLPTIVQLNARNNCAA